MTSVYINYPNPLFSLEHGQAVKERLRHDKTERRVFHIDPQTFSVEIARFQEGEVRFAASPELNDLWLEIDFGDESFERAVAEYIQRLLGRRYKPLAEAGWRRGPG